MAQQVVYTDDITGEPGAETVHFSFDGVDYEIDLGIDNHKELEGILAPYIDAARRVGSLKPRKASKSKAHRSSFDIQAIRLWARDNGYEVAARGRIPGAIVVAFNEADGQTTRKRRKVKA